MTWAHTVVPSATKPKGMQKILLVSMPYGALERQALGLSLLKANLNQSGVCCDVRYPMFAFADLVGPEAYQWVTTDLPHTAFAGEWTFAEALYGPRPATDERYIQEVLRDSWRLTDADIGELHRVRSFVPYFIDYCMESISWNEYALVGFTSTFEQNIASLSLARRLKRSFPGLATAFGGANWEGEMGLA